MKSINELRSKENGVTKCRLFDMLAREIAEGKDIKDILGIPDVLNTWKKVKHDDGKKSYYTLLTYAIRFHNIQAARCILANADAELLTVESTIYFQGNTVPICFEAKQLSALEYAKNRHICYSNQDEKNEQLIQDFASLIVEIEEKTGELVRASAAERPDGNEGFNDDTKIIKELQTKQAMGLGIIGSVMMVVPNNS